MLHLSIVSKEAKLIQPPKGSTINVLLKVPHTVTKSFVTSKETTYQAAPLPPLQIRNLRFVVISFKVTHDIVTEFETRTQVQLLARIAGCGTKHTAKEVKQQGMSPFETPQQEA